MEIGILERVLTRRYGRPITTVSEGLNALCWNPEEPDDDSLLYFPMKWNGRLGTRFASLREIYGDTLGVSTFALDASSAADQLQSLLHGDLDYFDDKLLRSCIEISDAIVDER